MTKLQYLRLRNVKHVAFEHMTEKDQCELRNAGSINHQLWRELLRPARWTLRLYPNDPLAAESVYRISEKLRPEGIPDDIHERYST